MEKLFSTNQFGICHRIWESDDINTQSQQSKKEIKEERRKEEIMARPSEAVMVLTITIMAVVM